MAKAQPITPGVSVISKKQLGTLVAEAARLHLNLSPSQARVLIHAAHEYAQAQDRDQALPRVGKTGEELDHIAELADQLSKALSDPKGSGIPLLDQAPLRDKDLSSALRKPLIDGLERTRGAARGIRGTLPVDKGGDPDPYYRKFVSLAQNIYIDAGGTGVGAYKSTHDDQGSAGKLIDLINAAIRLGPGDSYLKGKTATRKVIERLKERT
jgi:hypothetical protein